MTWAEIDAWQRGEALDTLRACGLREGMRVLDFGCGALYWTLPAARLTGPTGRVWAADRNPGVVKWAQQRAEAEGLCQLTAVRMSERTLAAFDETVDLILCYDLFHALASGREARIAANRQLLTQFHRLLSPGGVLSFAVFSELRSVQDPVSGPFTPQGKPKWFQIPYEQALAHYEVFPLIASCGFAPAGVVQNGGVHFDEIDKHMDRPKFADLHVSGLERRDIHNFCKK